MGTPVAPTYAQLFLYDLEEHIIHDAIFYRRYIDDIFSIFPNYESGELYIKNFNSKYPTIKLEAVNISKSGIFLDLEFNIDNKTSIEHTLYQKHISKFSYVPMHSNHNPATFKAFIIEELSRYKRSCTHIHDYAKYASLFKERLLRRGYSEQFVALAYFEFDARATLTIHQSTTPHVITNNNNIINNNNNNNINNNKFNDTQYLSIRKYYFNKNINMKKLISIPDYLLNNATFQRLFRKSTTNNNTNNNIYNNNSNSNINPNINHNTSNSNNNNHHDNTNNHIHTTTPHTTHRKRTYEQFSDSSNASPKSDDVTIYDNSIYNFNIRISNMQSITISNLIINSSFSSLINYNKRKRSSPDEIV
jgi:hypothetical protein